MRRCLEVQSQASPRTRAARFFGRNPLHPDARSWYQGALGEIEVGRVLDQLPETFTVLHAVPIGDAESDIDHVVIGPPGIFTINTKHHRGAKVFAGGQVVKVNGASKDYVRSSIFEASRTAELLKRATGATVEVTPLLVIVGAETLVIGKKKPVVKVLAASALRRFLTHATSALREDAIVFFSAAAEDRLTWQPGTSDAAEGLRYVARFERLSQEVRSAARRRLAWAVTSAAAVVATVVPVSLSFLPDF